MNKNKFIFINLDVLIKTYLISKKEAHFLKQNENKQ